MPQRELQKDAGQRCRHQRHTGCSIYAARPPSCRLWSCRWLTGDDTADLSRPDHSHYVVDILMDFVTAVEASGERHNIAALQVWVDPRFPDAHQDLALRAFIERLSIREGGVVALIRYNASDGFVLFPPSMTGGQGWIENHDGIHGDEHTAEEKFEYLGDLMTKALFKE